MPSANNNSEIITGDILNETETSDILTSDNHKENIKASLLKLKDLVPDKYNKYHIRRKTIFDDYVKTRDRSKWMKYQCENKVRVTFIVEPGIDGGGPKREFFTGTVSSNCMIL